MAEARSRERGFTLLELLVALTLVSMLMVALGGAIRYAAATLDRAGIGGAGEDELAPVQAALRRLIVAGRSFDGRSDRLEFVSPLPEAFELPGVYRIALFLSDDRLLLRWAPAAGATDGATSEGETGEVELARGIAEMSFGYFSGQPGAAGWGAATGSTNAIPLLVRVRLQPTGRGRRWPDLVVAPAIDSGPSTTG
jgi:general secretion pathway protein J